MKPEQVMRKRAFLVPIPNEYPGVKKLTGDNLSLAGFDGLQFQKRSQADFLREWYPSSHNIKSLIYYPNQINVSSAAGYQAKVHTRIAVAYQQRIKTKRKTSLMGNNIGMRLISNRNKQDGEDALAMIREGWEETNMEIGVDKCLDSDFITGDCAIYVYMSEGEVGWRTFSYADGDVLYPHYNRITGELEVFGRKYHQEDEEGNDVEYLDVIDTQNFVTYRFDQSKNPDGDWIQVESPKPHNFKGICPVAYHRRNEGPVWSASQSLIENYEMGISQFSENNLSYGLRILYTLGADFEVISRPDGTPARIDSSDASAKVGFLENADGADGAFTKQLDVLDKNIMRCSFAVETPELKSGADTSSLAVKMMFADSYIKAIEDSQDYQLFLDRVMKLFKYAYGICAKITDRIEKVKVKPYFDPFIFMSETEVVNALVQLVAAGVLSRQTATEIAYNSGYGTASEWDRILQEAHDEFVAGQEAQTQTKNNPVNSSRTSK